MVFCGKGWSTIWTFWEFSLKITETFSTAVVEVTPASVHTARHPEGHEGNNNFLGLRSSSVLFDPEEENVENSVSESESDGDIDIQLYVYHEMMISCCSRVDTDF